MAHSILGRQQSNSTKCLPWKNYWSIPPMKGVIFCHLQWKKLNWEAVSCIKCNFFCSSCCIIFFQTLCHIKYQHFDKLSCLPFRCCITGEDGFTYPLATGLEKKNFRELFKKIQIFIFRHNLKNTFQEHNKQTR